MGIGGIGPGSLILILLIVLVLFGGKKLRSLGSDLGAGIKGFKEGMNEEENTEQLADHNGEKVIDTQINASAANSNERDSAAR